MPVQHRLRILHISDLHVRDPDRGAKEQWRRNLVLGDQWATNVAELRRDGQPFDMVCFTGDLADWGQPSEYRQATGFIVNKILNPLGVPLSRFFIVPGNHDVQRVPHQESWAAVREASARTDPVEFSKWLAGGKAPFGVEKRWAEEVLSRQSAFWSWVGANDGLARPELLPSKSPHGLLGYRARVDFPNLPFPINVIGLDSSWMSGDDNDQGKLRLTDDQVGNLCTHQGKALPGFRLALIHHPIDYLSDARTCTPLLASHTDLLLRGHLHEPLVSEWADPDSRLRQIAAGSLYEGDKGNSWPNSFQVIDAILDGDGRPTRLDLRFRSWSAKGQGHWYDDGGVYRKAKLGRLSLEIAPSSPLRSATTQLGFSATTAYPRGLVHRFISHYLGSPEVPVPFGGRVSELSALNDWLNEGDGPRNCLVVGPAGRGKTALLVRWLAQLPPEWSIAFVPISIRFETNVAATFYRALAARLAEIVGDESAVSIADADSSSNREKVRDYLQLCAKQGKRCIVIIDGLDEAVGWQVDTTVLPLAPLPGIKFVVSARILARDSGASDWLRRIGWNARPQLTRIFEVPPLDAEGVGEVLESVGYPLESSSERSVVLAELLRLTEGEPLTAELYAKELLAEKQGGLRRLDLESLRKLQPGLSGYFKSWWDQQLKAWDAAKSTFDRTLVQEMLAALSCALGPFKFAELSHFLRNIRGLQGVLSADTIRPIERFVIGDGTKLGFSFSHPRLADYFREEHFGGGEEIRLTRAGYLAWGSIVLKGLNDGSLTPSKNPNYTYVLDHYAQHLTMEREPPVRLMDLVSDGWRRGWQTYEGTEAGFAKDVDIVWSTIKALAGTTSRLQEVATGLGGQIRCALCLSSISTTNFNVTGDLLSLCVEYEVITAGQAFAIARLNASAAWRGEAIIKLAPIFKPRDLVSDGTAMFAALPDANSQMQFLYGLTESSAEALAPAFLDLAPFARDDGALCNLISRVAKHLHIKVALEALRLARGIQEESSRLSALRALAIDSRLPREVRQGVLKDAFATARAISNEERASLRLFVQSYETGLTIEPSPSLYEDGLAAARNANASIASITTTKLIDQFTHEQQNTLRVASFKSLLSRSENLYQSGIWALMSKLISALPQAELVEALRLIRTVRDEIKRAQFLAAVAPRMATSDPDVVGEALLAVCALDASDTRRMCFHTLGEGLRGFDLAQVANSCVEAAAGQEETLAGALAFAFIANLLSRDERKKAADKAVTIALNVGVDFSFSGADQRDDRPTLRQAHAMVGQSLSRAETLSEVAALLPLDHRSDVLAEALHTARSLPKGHRYAYVRASALAAVASMTTDPERQVITFEAIAAAREIKDYLDKAEMLKRLPLLTSTIFSSQLMGAIQTIEALETKVEVLRSLSAYILPDDLVPELRHCLNEARRIGDERALTKALSAFTALQTGPYSDPRSDKSDSSAPSPFKEAVNEVREGMFLWADRIIGEVKARPAEGPAIWVSGQYLDVLIGVLPHLEISEQHKVATALILVTPVLEDVNDSIKRIILERIGPILPEDLALQAWKLALTIGAPEFQAMVLGVLCSRLPQLNRPSAIVTILELAPRVRREIFLGAITNAASSIKEVGGDVAIGEAIGSIRDTSQWWP